MGQSVTLPLLEGLHIDQKDMSFEPEFCRPALYLFGFLLERCPRPGVKLGIVAEPDIQVAPFGVGDAADTAHQVEAENVETPPRPFLVGEATAQLAGLADLGLGWVVVRNAGRRVGVDEAGQHRMIDVKQQRQQIEEDALRRAQLLFDALQAQPVNILEAPADGLQILAADAILEMNCLAHRHLPIRRLPSEAWRLRPIASACACRSLFATRRARSEVAEPHCPGH